MKKLKDYLHLYPGVDIAICEKGIEPVSHYLEGIDWENDSVIAERVNYKFEQIKPILRLLSNMTDEEAIVLANLCLSKWDEKKKDFISYQMIKPCVHLFQDEKGFEKIMIVDENKKPLLNIDDLWTKPPVFNFFPSIEFTPIPLFTYVSIDLNYKIFVIRENDDLFNGVLDENSQKEAFLYLLKQKFDVYGLISDGLALDKTKL